MSCSTELSVCIEQHAAQQRKLSNSLPASSSPLAFRRQGVPPPYPMSRKPAFMLQAFFKNEVAHVQAEGTSMMQQAAQKQGEDTSDADTIAEEEPLATSAADQVRCCLAVATSLYCTGDVQTQFSYDGRQHGCMTFELRLFLSPPHLLTSSL